MKVLKDDVHSFQTQPLELGGKPWMNAAILLYFDLMAPDRIYHDQQLWEEVPSIPGMAPLLDQGWPKPRGEFLVAGSCCAPRQSTLVGGTVSVRVGGIRKDLAVFGDRRWLSDGFGGKTISPPRPFSEMPLSWDRSFGGEGFSTNPNGKGYKELTDGDGKPFIPLPNIEIPDRLIASPSDRPMPAGFSLIPAHYTSRTNLSGTYDERWKRERWPGFPDDLDPDYFMAAPHDQQLPGYFDGNETIEIQGMNHEFPYITSRLPQRRVRLFFLKRPDPKLKTYMRQDLLDGEFVEANLHLDTLWLFPGILRGIVIYRALVSTPDETYPDIAWAHIADEDSASAPLPIEHYREHVLKTADFGQTEVHEQMQELQKELSKGAIEVRNFPKSIKALKAQVEGNAPQMQTTITDLNSSFSKTIAQLETVTDEIEASMKKLHEAFGHMIEVDFGTIDNARLMLAEFGSNLTEMMAEYDKEEKHRAGILRKAGERLKNNLSSEFLKEKGIDPDHLQKETSINPFHDCWFPFVAKANLMMAGDIRTGRMIDTIGIGSDVLDRNWVGLNDREIIFPENALLDEPLTLPEGVVIPYFNGPVLIGVVLRPHPLTDPKAAVIIPKSEIPPYFLEAACQNGALVFVPDEIAALLIEEEAGDFANVAVVPEPASQIPEQAKAIIDAEQPCVVFLSGREGDPSAELWLKTFPGIRIAWLHEAATIFEARDLSMDLRELILEQLPIEMAREHRFIVDSIADEGTPGTPINKVFNDKAIQAAIAGGMQELQAAAEAKMAPQNTLVEKRLVDIQQKAAGLGFSIQPIPAKASDEPINIADLVSAKADLIDRQREQLTIKGILPSEKAEVMAQAAKELREEGPRWQAMKEKIDRMDPPEELKAAFAKYGIDVRDLEAATQENLPRRLAQGRPFRMVSFTNLNLTGIDFSGKDLSMAQFDSCIMKSCCFRNADLSGTMFSDCDLEKSNFSEAGLRRTFFDKCSMRLISCINTKIETVSFNQCDMTYADLSGSTLRLISMEACSLKQSSLAGARIELAVLNKISLGNTVSDLSFYKTVIEKSNLTEVVFKGISAESLLLEACSGSKTRFENSKLNKFNIEEKCDLQDLLFCGCHIEEGNFHDAALCGACFSQSTVTRTRFECCNLSGADFRLVPLLYCEFPHSDLEGANFSGSNLFMGSLRKARIVKTDFSKANLFGVDFFRCIMRETNIYGANLKRSLIEGREQELRSGGYIL